MAETQRFLPLGGLDMDTDPAFVKDGDYTSAANVRHLTDDTESTQGIIPIKGNEYKFSIPSIDPQNKVFRVYFLDNVNTTAREITVQLENGQALATISFTDGATIADTRIAFKAAATAALNGASVPQTVTYVDGTDDTGSYTSMEIAGSYNPFTNSNKGYNYIVTSSTVNPLTIIITQEAIPLALSGQLQVIGSFDLLEDLFIFSTNQANIPEVLDLTVTGATNPGAPSPIVITTSAAHGLSDGAQVTISGVLGQTGANGTWTINVLSPTTFELINSIGVGAYSSSPDSLVTLYTFSIGQIGVMRQDVNDNSYNYYDLLTSREFGFRTIKQIDAFAERNNVQTNLYWTDDFNLPRVFYYSGDYLTNGALAYVSSTGRYEYGNINTATKLFINSTNLRLTFTEQAQSGGGVKSGNWRYSIRLLTETFVGTDYLDLSNPINVFLSPTTGSAYSLSGDPSGTTTTKINVFEVTNIPSNVFKYIELIGVNYIDNTQTGYTLSRTLISQNQTTISLQHTGFETAVTSLDLGLLNVRGLGYVTAKNIDALDNRLVLSNLTTGQSTDFSEWTQTWTHSLLKGTVDFVGDPYGTAFTVNEYQKPENVYAYMSFMANETYRLSAKYKLKNGTVTSNFWIDDIRIDTSATNVTTPNRRTAGLADYDITDYANDHLYYYYVQFAADLDTIIDGVAARDLIDEIIIEQVEMTESYREILASGVFVMGVEADDVNTTVEAVLNYDGEEFTYKVAGVQLKIGEYAFITGEDGVAHAQNFPTYPGNTIHAVAKRRHLAFYSPDVLYGLVSLSNGGSDQLINYGSPSKAYDNTEASASPHYNSLYAGYLGETGTVSPQIVDVEECLFLTYGQEITLGGEIFTKLARQIVLGAPNELNTWVNRSSPVIYSGSNLTNVTGTFVDFGIYLGQYYRPITYTASNPDVSKFGSRALSVYVPTGSIYSVPTSGNATINVSGDVFNQKTFVKTRFANTSESYPAMNPDTLGYDGGISFYSQNRVNSQMIQRYNSSVSTWIYPNTTYQNWMEQGSSGQVVDPTYNHGYDNRNSINADVAFDSAAIQQTDLPTRIIWSELKPQDSLTDNYRKFLALNLKDLEPTYGQITHHGISNGELVTWQQRRFMRQYFNARGQLETNDSLNVIIGDGAVMSRDGQVLTALGSKHKWGIIKGKSAQGGDTYYWVNTELKKIIRYGYDGTISLADIRGMQSFLANNLKWVDQFDTPANEFGICGFWDDRYAEAGWTVRARRIQPDWETATAYTVGQVRGLASQPVGTFSTFEEIGDLYICIENHTSGATTEPETGVDWEDVWEKIPQTNTDYFNEYTLIFNEFKNKFTAFYTPKPKIYLKWKDTYFSPRPATDLGDIYLHNEGQYLTWYDNTFTSQQEVGHIEGVTNKSEEVTKWFTALDVDCETTPYRFDFKTKNHISFLTEGEFEDREDGSFAPIKCDSTATPTVNDNDTTLLFGRWLKSKMTFEVGVYQKLVSYIVKYRPGARLFNR